MTKLATVVLQTQQAEEDFDRLTTQKLNDMAEHPNPATDESDLTMLKMYARTVEGMGENTDKLIRTWPEYEK